MGKLRGFVSIRMLIFNEEVKTIKETKTKILKNKKNHLLELNTRVTLSVPSSLL